MLITLLPQVKEFASAGRSGGAALNVPLDRFCRKSPHAIEMRRVLFELAGHWPRVAASISDVRAVRWNIAKHAYAEARVTTLATVGGRIFVSRADLQDPLLDIKLLGTHETGYTVGSTWPHVLVHEWGHLIVGMAVLTRYPGQFRAGLTDLMCLIEQCSPVLSVEAAAMLSSKACEDDSELLAEAFTDHFINGDSAHPFSLTVVNVLHELWPQSRGRWLGAR